MTLLVRGFSMDFAKAARCCYQHASGRAGNYTPQEGWKHEGWQAFVVTTPDSFSGLTPREAVLVRFTG